MLVLRGRGGVSGSERAEPKDKFLRKVKVTVYSSEQYTVIHYSKTASDLISNLTFSQEQTSHDRWVLSVRMLTLQRAHCECSHCNAHCEGSPCRVLTVKVLEL